MSPENAIPTFADYSLALQRLQRRADRRRALMSLTMGGLFESAPPEDVDTGDRDVLDFWERHHGPGLLAY